MKRKKTTPQPVVHPKKSPKSAIPTGLSKAIERIAKLLDGLRKDELPRRYEVGVTVNAAMANAQYGDRAVSTMARQLHLDENTLCAHASVTRAWPTKKFKSLAKRVAKRDGKGDYKLSWSHFVLIASDSDGRHRNRLVTLAFDRCLSEKQLREAKQELYGSAESPAVGRDPVRVVHALAVAAGSFVNKSKVLTDEVLLKLEGNPDVPSPELTEELKVASVALQSIKEFTDRYLDRINTMMKRGTGELKTISVTQQPLNEPNQAA